MPDKGKSRSSSRGRQKARKRPPAKAAPAKSRTPAGPPWEVRFHPKALEERNAVRKESEDDFDAIMAVIEKLKVHGSALKFPHQSGVQGKAGDGLRELRPTQGRTLRRPLYRRFEHTFVILAVGPEARVDQSRFNSAVADAQARRKAIEAGL
jgi:hypothetical protein